MLQRKARGGGGGGGESNRTLFVVYSVFLLSAWGKTKLISLGDHSFPLSLVGGNPQFLFLEGVIAVGRGT